MMSKSYHLYGQIWRKHNLTTNEIIKHITMLNQHGGKQVYGMNYYETYSPVVTYMVWYQTHDYIWNPIQVVPATG
jgi:hypothetical protein